MTKKNPKPSVGLLLKLEFLNQVMISIFSNPVVDEEISCEERRGDRDKHLKRQMSNFWNLIWIKINDKYSSEQQFHHLRHPSPHWSG